MVSCTYCRTETQEVFRGEPVCLACVKAVQGLCAHPHWDQHYACTECHAKPWTFGRVVKIVGKTILSGMASVFRLVMVYTMASVISLTAVGVLLYYAMKKFGIL